jgi:subtilisin family serine protease
MRKPQGGELAELLNLQTDQPELTGRSIVIFRETAIEGGEAKTAARLQSVLRKSAGIRRVATTLDVSLEEFDASSVASAQAVTLPRVGMAIIAAGDEPRVAAMSARVASAESEIEAIIPERYDYLKNPAADALAPEERATGLEEFDFDARTLRDAARALRFLAQLGRALAPEAPSEEGEALAGGCFSDSAAGTWGLEATGVLRSRFSGRGVRVAVLDTGFAIGHPDFRGRTMFAKSFVAGVTVNDVHGHGTHCIGTACGSQSSTFGPRYGVAFSSEIVVAKVFNNLPRPQAQRGDVIHAMDKAVAGGCRIISLSLGTATNGVPDLEYERAVSRVRRAGALVIAASGNENLRTGSPANSADAVSVAAVDSCLRRANFPTWGSNFGKVEIAGPGVDVLSSVPGGTRKLGGTSMATPHVAGIAALWLESQPGLTPDQLESALQRTARRLPQSASAVGAGLVQAP